MFRFNAASVSNGKMPMSVKNTWYDMIEIRVNGWSTGTLEFWFCTNHSFFFRSFFHFYFLICVYRKNQRDFDKNINDKSATLFHFLANERIMTNTFIRVPQTQIGAYFSRMIHQGMVESPSRARIQTNGDRNGNSKVNLDYVDGGADAWNMYIITMLNRAYTMIPRMNYNVARNQSVVFVSVPLHLSVAVYFAWQLFRRLTHT